MNGKKKIIVAVTGASGAIYAKMLLDKLVSIRNQTSDICLILSENGKKVWEYELRNDDYKSYPIRIYEYNDFYSPAASGSAGFDCMIIIPCSMGSLGKIANGIADNLIIRSADVMLKEKKKLILVTREMPLNLIHIQNMEKITLAGGIICPASPSFYSRPQNNEQIILTVVDRALILAGFNIDCFKWDGTDAA